MELVELLSEKEQKANWTKADAHDFGVIPIVHPVDQPYPVSTDGEHDTDRPRFGILHASFALNSKDEYGNTDPYGVVIEFYDHKTKQQGTVKLMSCQVPAHLWLDWGKAVDAIVLSALESYTHDGTDKS